MAARGFAFDKGSGHAAKGTKLGAYAKDYSELKISRKNENWPYRVAGRSRRTGKFQTLLEHSDLGYVKDILVSRGIASRYIPMVGV